MCCVTPAKAGVHMAPMPGWIPAFAGMTEAQPHFTHTVRFGDALGHENANQRVQHDAPYQGQRNAGEEAGSGCAPE